MPGGFPDTPGAPDPAARFDDALGRVDADAAVGVVDGLLDAGADPLGVLVDVIAAGLRRIGERWQRAEWTVAQEHAATAVAVVATRAVARHAERVPATRGHVVVACAEREWHALPATIIACALRTAGWETTLLGAATPARRLSQYLHDLGPDAVAVSCSVLGSLPATRHFIEAGTAAGIPVLVGGAAFGPDPVRALALGATAWAPDARAAVAAVAELPAVVPTAPALPQAVTAEQAALELAHDRLAADLRVRWSPTAGVVGTPPLDGIDGVVGSVVDQALHATSAALLTGDTRALSWTADWARALLAARGADPALVTELGDLLTAALPEFPLALDLVERHWDRGLTTSGHLPT
ncbi:cobalamin B12-binding domain-containing protein [Actinokineospora sp. PR83]|uniref:cobalamin B12-binding domain-containing protein n=1 Tax=Actinokineospora sp. PR83 TaxID=2884908 RepID=UPI001F19B53E|nr:cobalamin B12-binding domain-containing protein [Actinokineospora sp. PR83]MCG8917275.1 cobalamin B12-binding domain-containing protein [Actinokineospora sp. PR83]